MAKVRIYIQIPIFCLIFLNNSFAQIHKESNLNLPPNSTIEDIKYNDFLQNYIVVGDFESLGEVARLNMAFLDDELKIIDVQPVFSIDGSIKSVETNDNYLFIGGSFSEINGKPRNGLAVFNINPDKRIELIDFNPFNSVITIVSDIHFSKDQIIVLGKFSYELEGKERKNVMVLNQENLAFSDKLFQDATIDSYHPESLKIYETSSLYVITGDHVRKGTNVESSGIKFDLSGKYVGEIAVADDENKQGRELIHVKDNLFSYSRKPSNTTEIVITDIESNKMFERSPNPNSAQSSCYGNQLPDRDQEVYNGELFYIQDYSPSTTVIERYGVEINQSKENVVDFNSKWCNPITNDQGGKSDSRKLIAANNKLFYFDQRMKRVEDKDITNKGLVAFCLEAIGPKPFVNPTPDPCEKVRFPYTVHEVRNADGYEWKYTGKGANIKLASDTEAKMQSMEQDVVFYSKTANAVEMEFDKGFTEGELIVRAFTICNNRNERLYSIPISTPIINNTSKLQFEATANGASYNCENEVAHLSATTNIPGATIHWKLQAPISQWHDGASVYVNASEYDTNYYEYIAEFRYTSLSKVECVRKDTVNIPYYRNVPQLALTSNYLEFDCNHTSFPLIGFSSNSSDELWWTVNGSAENNSVTVDTNMFLSGTFYFHGKDTTSLCLDSIPLVISNNFFLPSAPLMNGSTFSPIVSIGEITCNNPNLDLIPGNASGQNSTFYFLDETQTQVSNSTLNSDHLSDVLYVVGQNGCENSFSVFATENKGLTNIVAMPDTALNCSVTELTLTHPENDLEGVNGWAGQSGNDVLLVTVAGQYMYEYINELNGCIGYDEITVGFNSEIDIEFTVPTYACQNESFSVEATAVGISTPNYTWETGSTSNTETGTGGTNDYLVVDVNDGGTCFGHDTVFVQLAPPIQNVAEQFQSCDNQLIFLNNTVTSGGLEPFEYSLDGNNFSSNNTFANLNTGNITVFIRDASTCVYQFPVEIVGGAPAPDLKFLAATYNKPDDLVALVNTTTFGGFDNVYWVLPPNIVFEYETDSIRFISALDTGYFDISLNGEIGSCTYSFTKQVYFGALDPVSFNIDEVKGIQNLNLYPNPNSGIFDVDVTFGVDQHYAIYISNIAGELIANSQQGFGTNVSEHFDISTYPPGTYVLKVISDFDNAYFPFVKQ